MSASAQPPAHPVTLPPWTPDLAALDLFVSVAELGSVGQAARRHGISQPSASARLARLERQLAVALLVRTPRGSRITPAGEAVVAWARTVLTAAHQLTDGVQSLRSTRSARLRVAASLTVAEYLLPGWLLTLRRQAPSVDVAAAVGNSHHVIDLVRAGEADLGFVESPRVPRDLTSTTLGPDRIVLLVAPGYPLARRARTGLRARDLLELPLILREPGSGTRDTVISALERAARTPRERRTPLVLPHAVELGSTATILATARAGGGVAVVSERAAEADLAGGTLVQVPVTDLELRRPLRAVWLGNRPTEHAATLVALARGSF